MNKSRRLWFAEGLAATFTAGVAALCLALCLGNPGWAQGPAKPAAPKVKQGELAKQVSVAEGTHELTGADLAAFLDGMMPAQLEREDLAGAVVAVVKDGQVLFAKGYGFSDVAKRKPVSPSETLFRPGSISKLFTWTSVMQQVEQGKLNLDQDVNTYLDFQIPPAFGKPITLRNIMTHTPGFEETAKELFVGDATKMRPLDEYLKQHIPGRIFPPGVTPAYSNYATTVAGYIVQRVSGKEFSQYVKDNIYTPLGMNHTTFVQPLPADLLPLMSNGYTTASKEAKPYEFVQAYPAGSVATSAADICNFMIAHLQDGRFGGTQILKPETAVLMHSRQFGSDQRLNGMALGFYEESRNGHRIIGHGGDTLYFHSDLHLILDSNVGFFVSYNSAGKGEVSARTILFEKFLDRYFPFVPPAAPAVASSKEDAQRVAGFYVGSRRGENTFLKLTELFGEPRVVVNTDGTISIDALKGPSGEPKKFSEVSPLLYREVSGQDLVGFHDNSNGRLEFSIDYPFFVFEKAGLSDNKHFNLVVLIGSLSLILLAVLYWPVGAAIRWHYGRGLELAPPEKRLRLAVRAVCLIDLACLLCWVVFISGVDDINNLSRSRDPFLYTTHFVGLLGSLGALIVLFYAFRSWGKAGRWIWAKVSDALLALACVGFAWFAWHWHLINFNLHY